MHRGTYSGGHTIKRADGSFRSYGLAEPRNGSKRLKNKKNKSLKETVKQSKLQSLAEQRKTVLNIAADSLVSNGKQARKFPRNIGDEVRRDVARIGTIEAWVSKQAGFNELVQKKLQKKKAKERRKNKSKSPVPVEVVTRGPLAAPKPEPDKTRIAFLEREIAQAQEFIRFAEKEIKRLKSEADQS